ncbi:tripartite motif-containing protein 2-like [Haliotis rufescens]|uniref:tripartite motif-containing protein 2-like n=1 Tax=Haliotis rufescens TaxID=6454 RepID=UPI00201F9F7F|nr:tripartite motif-containing protein 2-like [Haliotis rufescens]
MATAKKLTEYHLTCVICTEVFTNPATLQCHHTFCKSCLLKYTKTQPEAVQARSIPCPSCRQQTNVTNPDSPVEEWVSQLKPSHVIQGLMDDFGPSTKAVEENLCGVCTKQGKTTPATSWCSVCDVVYCEGCLQLHNMMPGLCDHEVAHLSDHTKTKVKRRFTCQVHRDKRIELFCKDCKRAICTKCCSIRHRTCKDVDTIESMTPLVKEQLTNKIEQLGINIAAANNILTRRKSKIQDVKSNSQTLKDQVMKTRETVMCAILRKEKQLLGDIDKSTDEQLHELQADIKSQEIELQMYQQQYKFTANAVTSNCEMDMYAVYESMGETSTDNRDTNNRPAAGLVVFTHDLDKLSKAVVELQLGEVQVVHDVSDPRSSPVLHHTIDCEEDGDGKDPWLWDVTVLTVDDIKVVVVADYNNKRLKTYYKSNFKSFHNELLLSNYPWQIAKLCEIQIAVSVPSRMEIVTVNVTPDPVLLSTIKTSKQYYALAALSPSQLAAGGYEQSHCVDILDMAGRILRSINTGVIGNPDHIHVTRNNNLIVSERGVKSLVSVTSEGAAVFTYTPTGDRALTYPWGITTTSTGDILLVDYDSHKVIQLTQSGQFVKDVLTRQDGLEHPVGVCLDGDGLLCVTSARYVNVFKFCAAEF